MVCRALCVQVFLVWRFGLLGFRSLRASFSRRTTPWGSSRGFVGRGRAAVGNKGVLNGC